MIWIFTFTTSDGAYKKNIKNVKFIKHAQKDAPVNEEEYEK
jgi:hypothetical protein